MISNVHETINKRQVKQKTLRKRNNYKKKNEQTKK